MKFLIYNVNDAYGFHAILSSKSPQFTWDIQPLISMFVLLSNEIKSITVDLSCDRIDCTGLFGTHVIRNTEVIQICNRCGWIKIYVRIGGL